MPESSVWQEPVCDLWKSIWTDLVSPHQRSNRRDRRSEQGVRAVQAPYPSVWRWSFVVEKRKPWMSRMVVQEEKPEGEWRRIWGKVEGLDVRVQKTETREAQWKNENSGCLNEGAEEENDAGLLWRGRRKKRCSARLRKKRMLGFLECKTHKTVLKTQICKHNRLSTYIIDYDRQKRHKTNRLRYNRLRYNLIDYNRTKK